MTPVFLDSVGILARWSNSDQWHAAAVDAYNRLLARRVPLVTTSFVLLECGNAAARRPFRQAADNLRDLLERRNDLIVPTDDDWRTAWDMYRNGVIGDAGIVDCTSLAVMRRLGITEAFSNDRHFTAGGITLLF
jgi:predicted nucleic acid-binding protein